MKQSVFRICCVYTLFCIVRTQRTKRDVQWEEYKTEHGKQYEGSEEEGRRRSIWENSMNEVEEHNFGFSQGLHSYTKGINSFSDRTVEELLRKLMGLLQPPTTPKSSYEQPWQPPPPGTSIPDETDWMHVQAPVKDQKDCSCCWAMTSAGALESHHALSSGKIVELSVQNLVDCVPPTQQVAYGCVGGDMLRAYSYVIANGGIDIQQSYPYENRQSLCRYNSRNVGAKCKAFVQLPTGDEEALKQAVATKGPVSVGINGINRNFQSYKSGIFDDPMCLGNTINQLNHAVTVVGYGTDDGIDYWLVKNSWGLIWGTDGYGKMSRNKNNQCGIASLASYPIV